MPTNRDPSLQLYLPVSLCEALETSGASSVASVATVATPSGQELVVVGSGDGHVYVVSGVPKGSHGGRSRGNNPTNGTVSWRLLAVENRGSLLDDADGGPKRRRWECPVHNRIQSLVAISYSSKGAVNSAAHAPPAGTDSGGGSPSTSLANSTQNAPHPTLVDTPVRPQPTDSGDYLLILVLSVQRASKTAMVHVYFVPNIDAMLKDSAADVGEERHLFPVIEWRKMVVPAGQAFPLRMFVDRSFSTPVGRGRESDAADAHHVLLTAMEVNSASPHILHGAIGILSLPYSGVLGSTPPTLHWVTAAAAASPVESADQSSLQKQCLSSVVARALLRAVTAPVSSLVLLAMSGAPHVLVAGCVDGEVVVLLLSPDDAPASPTNSATSTLLCIRCAGPIADLLVYHPRVHLTFPIPNAVLDELEECRYQRHHYGDDDHLRRVVILDSSGKVLMLVLSKKSPADAVQVQVTRLPDYTTTAEAKIAADFVGAPHTEHGTNKSAALPPMSAQRRSTPFPDMALGIQNRLAAVSNFFRNQDKLQRPSPAADIIDASRTAGDHHNTPHMSSSLEMPKPVTSRGDDESGALLGAGPIAISQSDVDGDGLYELVITTMGRFVALYRFLPETGTFTCIEAAEAPTHLFFCKQVRLWPHTAVPAWVMCGPSHILAHCGSTLRDIIASRAFLVERCLVGESLLET